MDNINLNIEDSAWTRQLPIDYKEHWCLDRKEWTAANPVFHPLALRIWNGNSFQYYIYEETTIGTKQHSPISGIKLVESSALIVTAAIAEALNYKNQNNLWKNQSSSNNAGA